MQHLTGFADLAARYDGFIIDLWGVIHDGVTPYDGAVDCLRHLMASGKPRVLLSNAPRRASVAQAAMRAMGIEDTLYTAILTSGEAVHQLLRDRDDPWFAALGSRVYHLGPERDRNIIEALPFTCVSGPDAADWVLNSGPDDHRDPTDMAEWESVLRACAARSLPMVCANPDLEVIRGGHRVLCAGSLAARYEVLGGSVRSIGKPDPAIYRPTLAMLGGMSPGRVLAVGDALRTDVAGATAAGIDACWVLGGLHNVLIGNHAATAQAAADAGLSPVAAIPAFIW